MRKSTAVAGAALIAIVVGAPGWYWASPFFAVAGLRNAAIRGDTKELNERVDFSRLRDEIKAQFSKVLIARMTESLQGNPFAALGVVLATKLTDVMVDTMITPAGIAALVEPAGKDRTQNEVSGLALMFSADFRVHREGLDSFSFYSPNEQEKKPTLRFGREGLRWRLVGVQIPKEFLSAKMGDVAARSQPVAPYVPKWESGERKDPMDDTVAIYLSRGAEEEVRTRFSSVRPSLIFRCRQKKLDAYINVRSSVEFDYRSYSANVRLRFDDNPAKRESWSVSDDREALFAPNATVLLNALLQAGSLQFKWHQSGGGPTVARFARDDLGTHAAEFSNRCAEPRSVNKH